MISGALPDPGSAYDLHPRLRFRHRRHIAVANRLLALLKIY